MTGLPFSAVENCSPTSRVCVLMPVFNGLPYLKDAMESILSQTFTDFEFLIIDDASTDATCEVVRSYDDERIRLVHNEENIGLTLSLNRGLSMARSEYVARLDHDDICQPTRLEKEVVVLDSDAAVAAVGTQVQYIDEDGREGGVATCSITTYADYLYCLMRGVTPLFHPSVMFRKSVVLELGGYDAACYYAQDYDLWMRMALAGHRAHLIPEPLLLYRRHAGQVSVAKRRVQLAHAIEIQEKFLRAFCPESHIDRLRLLLDKDARVFEEIAKRESYKEFLATLDAMLRKMGSALDLDRNELYRLARLVYGDAWLMAAGPVHQLRVERDRYKNSFEFLMQKPPVQAYRAAKRFVSRLLGRKRV